MGLNIVVLSYFVHNSFICWDVDCGPLSVMNTLGMPSQAIMFLFFNEFDYRIALMLTYASTIVVVNMNASIAIKRIASFRTH